MPRSIATQPNMTPPSDLFVSRIILLGVKIIDSPARRKSSVQRCSSPSPALPRGTNRRSFRAPWSYRQSSTCLVGDGQRAWRRNWWRKSGGGRRGRFCVSVSYVCSRVLGVQRVDKRHTGSMSLGISCSDRPATSADPPICSRVDEGTDGSPFQIVAPTPTG